MTRSHLIRSISTCFGLFFMLLIPAKGDDAYVNGTSGGIVLGNDSIELFFSLEDSRHPATVLTNKLAKKRHPLAQESFSLEIQKEDPLSAGDFEITRIKSSETTGGQRLSFGLQNASRGLNLEIVYDLGDHDFFIRRRLELTMEKPLSLQSLAVWIAGIDGNCTHQGYGEPVFLEDTFWGLEYPGGDNRYAGSRVTLTHYPGRTLHDQFISKTAVVGVAEPGRLARRFQHYVESLQAVPGEQPLFVNYNTWWTLMPPTEENCLELIDTFKRELFDPHGESFDTFTIDDGWDDKNSLWKIRSDRFPRGFAPLIPPLESMNANLGLWLSPSSGYGHAPWLGTHGYEQNTHPVYICQSGPNYRRDIVERVTELARTYDLAFFKFDGFCATCEAPDHGHLPGPYGSEANIDAYIELLEATRNARPGVYLDPTCGIWLSPWWLMHADSFWGSVSGDYPSIIVPGPVVRDSATTTRDAIFRQRCREHPGFPPAAMEHLGIIVITNEKWEDNAVAVAGRGSRLLTLYINPALFPNGARDWAFLASLLKWVRAHAGVLQHTVMIPGDPLAREPYGFAHFSGTRGILSLRNPFIDQETMKVTLDASIGLDPGKAGETFLARIVYPRHEVLRSLYRHGDALEVTLAPYETLAIHIESIETGQPVLMGARAREIDRNGTRLMYEILAAPGEELNPCLTGDARPIQALLDGRPVPLSHEEDGAGLRFKTDDSITPCSIDSAGLELEITEENIKLAGQCFVHVPRGPRASKASKASMHLLCDTREGAWGSPECTVIVDKKPVEVRAIRAPEHGTQTHKSHSWCWFEFDLPEGESDVSVVLTLPEVGVFLNVEAGWWLMLEHTPARHTLEFRFAGALPDPPSRSYPLPINMQRKREVMPIQAPKVFRPGSRRTNLGGPVIYLDTLYPSEVTQGWGSLQRNRSVWKKPMVIAGHTLSRGLGTHAAGRIAYELEGLEVKRFRCQVGRDSHAADGAIVLQVRVNGKVVFDSGPMTKASPPKQVEVELEGARLLELITLDGGDGINGDHGNWGDACFLR